MPKSCSLKPFRFYLRHQFFLLGPCSHGRVFPARLMLKVRGPCAVERRQQKYNEWYYSSRNPKNQSRRLQLRPAPKPKAKGKAKNAALKRCWKCRETGHVASECSKKGAAKKQVEPVPKEKTDNNNAGTNEGFESYMVEVRSSVTPPSLVLEDDNSPDLEMTVSPDYSL